MGLRPPTPLLTPKQKTMMVSAPMATAFVAPKHYYAVCDTVYNEPVEFDLEKTLDFQTWFKFATTTNRVIEIDPGFYRLGVHRYATNM